MGGTPITSRSPKDRPAANAAATDCLGKRAYEAQFELGHGPSVEKVSHADGLCGLRTMTTATMQRPTIGVKKDAIIYWTTTGIISAIMLLSAYYFCFIAE